MIDQHQHRPQHPIDHEKHNRASDAHYESKRPGLIREYLAEMAGVVLVFAIIIVALVVTP
jgi:hypothetical protein